MSTELLRQLDLEIEAVEAKHLWYSRRLGMLRATRDSIAEFEGAPTAKTTAAPPAAPKAKKKRAARVSWDARRKQIGERLRGGAARGSEIARAFGIAHSKVYKMLAHDWFFRGSDGLYRLSSVGEEAFKRAGGNGHAHANGTGKRVPATGSR
jgi:hypothetical protein